MRLLAYILIAISPIASYFVGYRDGYLEGRRNATSPPCSPTPAVALPALATPLGPAHPGWRDYDAAGGQATTHLDGLEGRAPLEDRLKPAPTPSVHVNGGSLTF